MEQLKKLQRILGTAFDIRDTTDLVIRLSSIGGATTMITAAINWIGRNIPPLSLVLFGIGLFMLLLAILPRIMPRVFALFRKKRQPIADSSQKYADWMSTALSNDMSDLRNKLFIYFYDIDFKHLIDDDSYFEIIYQIRSSSIFTLDISEVSGHTFYENSEQERVLEIHKPIKQLERSGHDKLVLRQWVSAPMMNRVTLDGGKEITFHFNQVNVLVNANYPDGSKGPQCRLNIPSKITKRMPSRVELEG